MVRGSGRQYALGKVRTLVREGRLDVYRPWLNGQRMYVKFTLDEDGDLYVLSFCRDGDHH